MLLSLRHRAATPRSRFRGRFELRRTALSIATLLLAGVAAATWLVTLSQIDLGAATDLGLVSIIPVPAVAALAMLIALFVWSAGGRTQRLVVPTVQLVLLIIALYGVMPVAGEATGNRIVYRHLGIIDYISRNGMVDGGIDAYFNWPGFFIFEAFLAQSLSLANALTIADWAPAFFNLAYLPALALIYSSLGASRKVMLLAIAVFLLGNWPTQDYFSPQAFSYLLYLLITGILLHWYRGGVSRSRVPFLRLHVPAPSAAQSLPRRVAWLPMVLVIGLFAVIAPSHQLTPFAVLAAAAMLYMAGRLRSFTLLALMAVIVIAWLTYGAPDFLDTRTRELLAQVGQDDLLAQNVSDRLSGTPEHGFVVQMRLATGFALWSLGMLGWLLGRRSSYHTDALLLMLSPFVLLPMQRYGGEMGIRVYFFSLPFAAFLVASLVESASQTRALRVPTPRIPFRLAAAVVLLLLGASFLVSRYGNVRSDSFSPDEVALVAQLQRSAGPGALLLSASGNVPWKATHYDDFKYADLTRFIHGPADHAELPNNILALMTSRDPWNAYFLVTDSATSYLQTFGYMNAGEFNELERRLEGRLVPLARSDAGTIYVLPNWDGRNWQARDDGTLAAPLASGDGYQLSARRLELAGVPSLVAEATSSNRNSVLAVVVGGKETSLPLSNGMGTIVLPLEDAQTASVRIEDTWTVDDRSEPSGVRHVPHEVAAADISPVSAAGQWSADSVGLGLAIGCVSIAAAVAAFWRWRKQGATRAPSDPSRPARTAPVQHRNRTAHRGLRGFPMFIRATLVASLSAGMIASGLDLIPAPAAYFVRLGFVCFVPGFILLRSMPQGWQSWVLLPAAGLILVPLASIGSLYLDYWHPSGLAVALGAAALAYIVAEGFVLLARRLAQPAMSPNKGAVE